MPLKFGEGNIGQRLWMRSISEEPARALIATSAEVRNIHSDSPAGPARKPLLREFTFAII